MFQESEVQQFNRLYKELDDHYHEIALAMGLSDSAFAVMYVVGTLGDGCLQRDICREAYVSKQTVNSSMRNLERQGYLYLEQSGRDKHIRLTDKGKQFVEEKIRPVVDMENGAFLEMEPEERAEFIRLSRKYVDGFAEKEKKLLEVLS